MDWEADETDGINDVGEDVHQVGRHHRGHEAGQGGHCGQDQRRRQTCGTDVYIEWNALLEAS